MGPLPQREKSGRQPLASCGSGLKVVPSNTFAGSFDVISRPEIKVQVKRDGMIVSDMRCDGETYITALLLRS